MEKILMAAGMAIMTTAYGTSAQKVVTDAGNLFLAECSTPFGVPPFDRIKVEHYKEAFLKGMEEQKKEIDATVNQRSAPDFDNIIAAFDQSGELLNKVNTVFYGLNSCNTNDEIQALNKELIPLLSAHRDGISLNPVLSARVEEVHERCEQSGLDKEWNKLLEETYKKFARGGVNLDSVDQAKLRQLNSETSMLQLTFGQNPLKETNAFRLVTDKEEDLAGLPESLVASTAEAAKLEGPEGEWLLTLHSSSVMPSLQHVDNHELREKIFKGYINRGNNGNETDNSEIVKKLVTLRLEKAKLTGYADCVSYVLEDRMAENEENAYRLLNQIWTPGVAKAKEELVDIQAEIRKEGANPTPEGWDWRYYFEKAKKAKFSLDENEICPYLELNNVRDGAFYVANKLYGITSSEISDMPKPHEEAQVFECKDRDGSHLGVLCMDFFSRSSKRTGIWCGTYRSQTYRDGKRLAPVVTIVCNLTKPSSGQPALPSADEASILFHEFGHALHNLFKDVRFYGVSGVPRDFVELPS